MLQENLSWEYDPVANAWKMKETIDGISQTLTDGFYIVYTKISDKQTTDSLANYTNDTYYFDKDSHLVTGWLQTIDNRWYFFDTARDMNMGKMALGWKYIDKEWYYFTADGSMLVSGMSPDGYQVDANGKFVHTN